MQTFRRVVDRVICPELLCMWWQAIEEYDAATQAEIRKIMFEQRAAANLVCHGTHFGIGEELLWHVLSLK